MLEVQPVVLVKWFFEGFVDCLNILSRNRVDGGIFMHTVDASLLTVANFIEVVLFFVVVVRDETGVGHDEDTLFDILPEMFGDE